MKITKIVFVASLVGTLFAVLAFALILEPKQAQPVFSKKIEKANPLTISNEEALYSKETDLPLVSSDALFQTTYKTLEEMYGDAEIVAEIKVKSQEVFVREEWTAETLSEVNIVELYKGNPEIKNIKIAEIGGPIYLTEEENKYKNKPGGGKDFSSTKTVESTLEGVPVIKAGNHYLVFLKKNYGSDTFSPLGSIQGKIKLDKIKKKAVATIEPGLINEEVNFFQKSRGKSRGTVLLLIFPPKTLRCNL